MTPSQTQPKTQPKVAVIGAGISGICMAIKLKQAGVDFVLFEKAASIGGTWRDNAYPGLNCDVPGYVYTYSFARDPISDRWLPKGPEIRAYLERVFADHDLAQHTRFNAEIASAKWCDDHWSVRTAEGHDERFEAIVHATGYLHHAKVPDIPGQDSFGGVAVHSARWRQDIEWRDKRVGVIGNGSSGVQLVGGMASGVTHLTSFQRTAQWVFPMANPRISPRLVRLVRRWPRLGQLMVEWLERLADYFLGTASVRAGFQRRGFERACRAFLQGVKDPVLRAKLTPSDGPLCKRPVMSRRYYRAVQRDNVSVVTDPIERIEADGVVTADGTKHPLDLIVYATGFHPHAYMRPMQITGTGGLTLDEAWKSGPSAYRTMAIPGFPNMFLMLGPHSPLLAVSIHSTVEHQADYIVQMVDLLRQGRATAISATPVALERWLEEIRGGVPGTVWDSPSCSSWYLGEDRVPILWPFKRARWYRTLRPELDDYDLSPAPPAAAP